MFYDALKTFGKLFLIVTVVFTVAFYALSLVLGPALFFFTSEGLNVSMIYKESLPGWILILPVTVPIGLELGTIFLGVSIVITLSFITAWKLNKNFHQTIKNSVIQPTKNLFQNSLFGMTLVNSMTLIAVLFISRIQESSGIPTGTTPIVGEPFLDLLDLSYSAVVEEIGFRLIPIGGLLVILLLLTKKTDSPFSFKQNIKLFFLSFLFPDKAKRLTGNKTVAEHGILAGISLPEWGMIVFTTVIFGLAHYNPGVSWEIGKISSATLSGFVLAITYLVYGIHAPLLMHWFFNSYNEAYYLLADLYPSALPLANSVVLFSLTLGTLGWILLIALGYLKLVRKNRENKTMQPDFNYSDSASIS
ncbi:MAG: CPBP family glutamic-type intramembrane protease [Candidatus Bathyarchaeum tardum]|nr:MAG: CPBP family glutamic-type intramembrane protease [Candidatus Bathyarchaeum tardum]